MTEKAKLACIGGGVAALYLAIAIKNKNPDMDIDIYEKSDKVLNTGWGIILKNNQLKSMEVVDIKSYHEILKKSASNKSASSTKPPPRMYIFMGASISES